MCLAKEVESAVINSAGFKKRFGTLAAHPYDVDKPDRTVWWLFPGSKIPWGNWPAYAFGKFFFDRRALLGVMRAGLHIEKGIAVEYAQKVYGSGKGKFFGMTPDWAWHGFLNDLESGRLGTAMAEMAKRSGVPVEVTIEPSFPLDEPVLHEKFGHHRFEVTTDSGLKLVDEQARPDKLVGIGQAKSLLDLTQRLRQATAEEKWTWVNVFVSVSVPHLAEPPIGAGPAWTGSDFWHRVLEPLADWVK
jgi:hypothetical protein